MRLDPPGLLDPRDRRPVGALVGLGRSLEIHVSRATVRFSVFVRSVAARFGNQQHRCCEGVRNTMASSESQSQAAWAIGVRFSLRAVRVLAFAAALLWRSEVTAYV